MRAGEAVPLAQAATAAWASWAAVENTYRLVVKDAKLLEMLSTGAAEFTPAKGGGIFSQIRALNGPALGEASLHATSGGIQAIASLSSIFGAINQIMLEAKLQRIEDAVKRVEATLEASISIKLEAKLVCALQACRKMAPRLVKIEMSLVDEENRHLQRLDFDARLRDLQRDSELLQKETQLWIEEQGNSFGAATSVEAAKKIKARMQEMWHLHLSAAKLRTFCCLLEAEKEKLRGASNLASLAEENFRDSLSALFEAPEWLTAATDKMKDAKTSNGLWSWLWSWLTDAPKKLETERTKALEEARAQGKAVTEAICQASAMKERGLLQSRSAGGVLCHNGRELIGRFNAQGIFTPELKGSK